MDTWYLNWCSPPLADCNGLQLVSTVPPKGISWWRHIVLSVDETWCCCETLIHRPTWSSGIDQEYGHYYEPWTLPVLENDAHWAFPRGMVALIKNEECNVARIQPRGLQGLTLYRCQRRAIESLKQMGMTQDLLFKQPKSYRIQFGKMNLFHGFDSSTRVVLVQGYGMNMARKSACGFHCIGIVITIWYECCIPCPQYQRYRNSIKIIARPYQIHIGKPSWNTYI